ncbi:MAG TPA: UDP-N-acetylmuramoyl-tripeptide--D-alanyl-D-alanine ligase [Myxococcota bacterium]|nr:UDP-N-acetylmuramoyl-tripeptide--D-alanyl-D-alanine ligase [Myxococcota bacterium]
MTLPFRAREAAAWAGAALVRGDAESTFTSVSIDTRTLAPGALFVAIRGENHDAHAFVANALASGAAGVLVEHADAVPADARVPVLVARDSTRALGALAAGHRASFRGPVVAITGSNGKTTTKEMCAAILGELGPCLATQGNLNNQFGLPLTLLRRGAAHRTLVVELGMNHRGEIAPLAAIARPTIGVITTIGTAHIEFLGSREAIAEEKGDLVAALPPDGVAVLPGDDALARAQAKRCRARVVFFGRSADCEVRPEDVRAEGDSFAFRVVAPQGETALRVAGLGEPTVSNALAASAACLAAGASLAELAAGLARYAPAKGRMQRVRLASGAVVIDDTYNANPQSMQAALESLVRLRGAGRAFAVLGDMGELGAHAEAGHRSVGALAGELRVDALYALGEHAALVREAALAGGLTAERTHVAASHDEIAAALRNVLRAGDVALVKGSRSMRMERVVEALTGTKGDH